MIRKTLVLREHLLNAPCAKALTQRLHSFLIINKARFLSKFFAFKLTEKSVPFPLSRCSYLHCREGNVEDKKFRVQRLIALSVTGTQEQDTGLCIPRTWASTMCAW